MFMTVSRPPHGQHPTLRQAGVSEPDCEAIKNAFVYDGLFYENDA